jgi:hypothetical protein
MLLSKSTTYSTSELSLWTFNLSPISTLFILCLKNLLNLVIPISVMTKSNLHSINHCIKMIGTPVASIASSPSVPSLTTVTIPKISNPMHLSQSNSTDKILAGEILSILKSFNDWRIITITS